ncbi:MAG: SMP-30/gluconolactonase/LRE family protein [Phormidesmis sp.]
MSIKIKDLSTEPSILVASHNQNAENPLWHAQHQCLYWSDIPQGQLFRYDLEQDRYEKIYSGKPVGGFTIQADGSLLLLKAKGTVEIWREGRMITVISEIPEARDTRFNDAIADPKGRVFSGTIASDRAAGHLYRIDMDGSYQVVVEDVKLPNGMAFSADHKHFFLTDSDRRHIYRFDYDVDSGQLSNQHTLITIPEGEGVPDGLTIDADGYLWSARWEGGGVYRYDPDGTAVMKLKLPTAKVSCVSFGGKNYERLFISTAGGDGAQNQPADSQPTNEATNSEDAAGNLFHFCAGVNGRPEFFSRVQLNTFLSGPEIGRL